MVVVVVLAIFKKIAPLVFQCLTLSQETKKSDTQDKKVFNLINKQEYLDIKNILVDPPTSVLHKLSVDSWYVDGLFFLITFFLAYLIGLVHFSLLTPYIYSIIFKTINEFSFKKNFLKKYSLSLFHHTSQSYYNH